MGKSDDPSPKVRPFGEETQPTPSRSLTIAGATLAVIVAASAFFISTSPDETPPLPTLPQASLATTSTTEPTASNAPSVPPLPLTRADLNDLEVGERIGQLLDSTIAVWDAVPEAHGDLVAVIGSPAGTDLIRVGNDGAILLLERPNRAESVAFDRSGQLMAYIGDSPNTDSALYVESFSIAEAYSFSWHATVPGRIAWLEHGPERLCWADLPEPESLTALSCIRGLAFGTELVAFDDYGFITIDRAGRSIERLRPDGQRVASVAGDDIVLGPSERLLVIDRGVDTTDETTFTVISRDFTDPVRLDWAPSDPAGTPIVAAWSPSVVYPEIAFLIWAEDHHQLQVYDLEGHLNHTVDLEGRVWGLEWDSTGRYLLIPGTRDPRHDPPSVHLRHLRGKTGPHQRAVRRMGRRSGAGNPNRLPGCRPNSGSLVAPATQRSDIVARADGCVPRCLSPAVYVCVSPHHRRQFRRRECHLGAAGLCSGRRDAPDQHHGGQRSRRCARHRQHRLARYQR